jgi:hypothetical protein
MLLTPAFVGLLLADAAFWTLTFAAIHKLDEIPYLKEDTSTQQVLDWIEDNKGLTLVITEGANFFLHGLSPHGVMFRSRPKRREHRVFMAPKWRPQ